MSESPREPAARPADSSIPWGRLASAVGVASDPKKLILAVVGLLLLHAGWAALDYSFPGSASITPPFRLSGPPVEGGGPVPDLFTPAMQGAGEPYSLMRPFVAIFDPGGTFFSFAHALMASAWAAAVWGLFGGAIARIAVVQLASIERVGLMSALRFAARKFGPLFVAPLAPVVAAFLIAALVAPLGLLDLIPGTAGATVASALFIVPLLAATAMALILLILAVGWPLMHATVAAEGEDAFDAISRSYAFVNQRLPRLAVLVFVALVLGAAGQFVVGLFARTVVHLATWTQALAASQGRLPKPSDPTTAAAIQSAWLSLVDLLVHAWSYSYFWSAAAVIYLVLRREVDGTPWHVVYLDAHDLDTFAPEPPAEGLPPTPVPAAAE